MAGGLFGRAMHLIDVENLLGTPTFDIDHAQELWAAYVSIAPIGTADHVVIATSHHAATSAWFGWPASARRLVRSGPDGADLALSRVVAVEHVERRFDRVVIGSGDGFFAEPAARLKAAGCGVSVVARRLGLSRKLSDTVPDIRFLMLQPMELPASNHTYEVAFSHAT
jgi:hypothetical protein